MTLPRLHVVTDDGIVSATGFAAAADALLRTYGAAIALQLRAHATTTARVYTLAERLSAAAAASGATLIVNDRVDVALAIGVPIHLGARSLPVPVVRGMTGPDRLIGYSAHDPDEAARESARGADYLIVGTIWPSRSHPDRRGAGGGLLRAVAAAGHAPVLAIGGVTPDRVADAVGAGAYGVAVLSGIWDSAEPVVAAAAYLEALDSEAG